MDIIILRLWRLNPSQADLSTANAVGIYRTLSFVKQHVDGSPLCYLKHAEQLGVSLLFKSISIVTGFRRKSPQALSRYVAFELVEQHKNNAKLLRKNC